MLEVITYGSAIIAVASFTTGIYQGIRAASRRSPRHSRTKEQS